MNDGPSSFGGLQKEWSLLVHSFLDQAPTDKKIIPKLNPQDLTMDQVKILKKDLSHQRKVLNQKIEAIKSEIEKLSNVIENLKLVGSSTANFHDEIDLLHQSGEKISGEIFIVEQKINKIHDLKDRMMKLPDFSGAVV